MKNLTTLEVSKIVNGKLIGSKKIKITGFNSLDKAKEGEISFLENIIFKEKAKVTSASCIIVPSELEINKAQIICSNPKLAFTKIMQTFLKKMEQKTGIHPQSIIGDKVKLGKDIFISPFVFIEENCKIGNKVKIYAFVYIGKNVEIGEKTIIYPNVTIQDNVKIGKNVIIHPGVVIGSDGFGFVKDENNKYIKVPQVGKVIIEDDVEIGANTCIDKAMLEETRIGSGTKLDNLIQVGHNVKIGENCVLAGQVGISGSVTIGNRVVIAGQVGIADHITIGDDSIILGQAGITKSVPSRSLYSGYPAGPHSEKKRIQALINQLPNLFKRIKELEKSRK